MGNKDIIEEALEQICNLYQVEVYHAPDIAKEALTEYRKRKNVSEEELDRIVAVVFGTEPLGSVRHWWTVTSAWKEGYRAAMERMTK